MANDIDIFSELGNMLDDATESGENFNKILEQTNRKLLDISTVAESFSQNWEDLPKHITSGKDLLAEITKDSKLFNKVQEQSLKLSEKMANDSFQKMYDSLLKQHEKQLAILDTQQDQAQDLNEFISLLKQQEELEEGFAQKIVELGKDRDKTEQLLSNHLTRQLAKLQKQAELADKFNIHIKEAVDTLAAGIRQPAQTAENMLGILSDFPNKLMDARNETGSWGEAMGKVFAESKMGKFLDSIKKGGPMIAGIIGVTAALTVLWKLFKNYWDFLDKEVIPAQARFNQQIGATSDGAGKLKGQMNAVGVQFELLGYSFEEGSAKVRDLSLGMNAVKLDKDVLKTGVELQAILGVTGEEAGKMGMQFVKSTGSIDGLNTMMNAGAGYAKAWGLPVNKVLKDIAGSPEILARFGAANSVEMGKAAAVSRDYGVSIKEVNAAFGKQMDTFEGSADAASKLNAIFGTNINSLELMMETDPTKRMLMLREELERQGKTWDKLDVFQKNVITSSLGVDETQASLILSSEKERKKLEAKRKAREKEIKINEKWNQGLGSIKKTLIAWGPLLNTVSREVTKLVSSVLGFDEPGKEMSSTANKIENSMKNLTLHIQIMREDFEKGEGTLYKVVSAFEAMGPAISFVGDLFMWFVDVVAGGWAKLFDKQNWAAAFSKDTWIGVGMALKEVFLEIKLAFTELIDWMAKKASFIIDPLSKGFSNILDFFTGEKGVKGIDVGKPIIGGGVTDVEVGKPIIGGGVTDVEVGKPVIKKNDYSALIKPNGEVIEFSPQDNLSITAKKNMSSGGGGGSSGGRIERLENMVSSLVRELKETRTVQANLHIDGRKISSSQVRMARGR